MSRSQKNVLAVAVMLFSFIANQVSACNRFNGWIDNGDGTVLDPRTKIIWQNCNTDKSNPNLCAENMKYKWMNYSEAMALAKNDRFLGKSDWRIPTIVELYKSTDEWGCWSSNGVFSPVFNLATNRGSGSQQVLASPDINIYTSENMDLSSRFTDGYNGGGGQSTDGYVILIRSDDSRAQEQFNQAYNNTIRLKSDKKIKADKELRQKALEAQEKADAEKRDQRQLDAALQSKNPQSMYLAAGKYEREGRQYEARQVYERLIEKFPSSSWAIKANDQLLQSQRVDSVTSSARNATSEANNRAYKACQIEMDSCYSRNGSNCYRDCKSLR